MKHLLCVHQALLKFRFLGRRGLLGHFCDLIPRLGWSAMERWPRARLSWEWIWWEPLLSEPSTVFPTASLNRFTCSFPGSILATNLLFCPVGANIFWKITKPSNIGFLVFFFFPQKGWSEHSSHLYQGLHLCGCNSGGIQKDTWPSLLQWSRCISAA